MYKQRCVGTQGALMPTIFTVSCGLILYSAADAGVRGFGWSPWAFIIAAGIFVLTVLAIHRYTRVEVEYVWFSGELIVRLHENGRMVRYVLRQQSLRGMKDRHGRIGSCEAGRARNCCATLRGRLFCTTLYYNDEHGHAYRLFMQPNPELRELIWREIKRRLNDTF